MQQGGLLLSRMQGGKSIGEWRGVGFASRHRRKEPNGGGDYEPLQINQHR